MYQIDLQFHNCRRKKGTNKESSNDRSLRYTFEPADVFVRLSRRIDASYIRCTIFRYAEKKKSWNGESGNAFPLLLWLLLTVVHLFYNSVGRNLLKQRSQ